jgi:Ca-activated chloride channel family protein
MDHRLPLAASLVALLAHSTSQAQEAQSSFGHARTRELAELGKLPTVGDVVVRDIVDYHRHRLPLPKGNEEVALDVRCDVYGASRGDEVWVQVGYTTAPQGNRGLAEPCAVALVIDVSGSMQEAGKMTAVKAGLRAFVDKLRPDDDVAVVTFSTEAQVAAPRRARGDGRWLLDAIERLEPGGNTNLHAGLMLGIAELAKVDAGKRQRRVVLLTDGIANTGVTEPGRIVDDATRRAETAIDISTIGVGQDLDTALLQRLADGTRGLFHFVADAADVQKVFVQEADALLTPIARRPRLVVDLPHCLQIVQVYDERARVRGDRIEAELPDLNAGVTGVVLARCRVARGEAGNRDEAMRAELSFASASTGRTASVRADTDVRVGDRDANDRGRAPDVEVRKNAAIAVLAQGLADMASACDARRWADADRALQRASDDAQRLWPDDDEDVKRVREMVAGHSRTLRRYVDRFRDF